MTTIMVLFHCSHKKRIIRNTRRMAFCAFRPLEPYSSGSKSQVLDGVTPKRRDNRQAFCLCGQAAETSSLPTSVNRKSLLISLILDLGADMSQILLITK